MQQRVKLASDSAQVEIEEGASTLCQRTSALPNQLSRDGVYLHVKYMDAVEQSPFLDKGPSCFMAGVCACGLRMGVPRRGPHLANNKL